MRGGNERYKLATPRRVWGGDVNADHRPLLNGDRVNAGELSDQIAKVRLVPNEEEGVVTTSGKELGDMRRRWSVGEVLVNGGGGL